MIKSIAANMKLIAPLREVKRVKKRIFVQKNNRTFTEFNK